MVPRSTFRYESNFIGFTRSPRRSSKQPIEAAARRLPKLDTTSASSQRRISTSSLRPRSLVLKWDVPDRHDQLWQGSAATKEEKVGTQREGLSLLEGPVSVAQEYGHGALTTHGLQVFLGNGDGTFASAITNSQSGGFITTCDFNGDGNLDLAVANAPASVAILLGDGHGNFTTASDVAIGGALGAEFIEGPTYVACGDFNGDGKTDLIMNDPIGQGSTSAIAYGNGDGTFGGFSVFSNGIASVVAVADFNSDGLTDLVTDDYPFMTTGQTASVTFNGVSVTPGSGSQQVVASYPGDSNYWGATSQAISLQAAQGTPTVSVTASAASITQGWSVVLTATVSGGGIVPTGSVIFYDGSGVLGTAKLNSAGIATYSANALVLGTNSITASYEGDTNYAAASSAALVVTVTVPGSTASTVTVKPSSTSVAAGQPLTVSVTVSGAGGGATPSGSVNLATGSYSTWQPLSSGTASFTLPAGTLSSGANTLTASYPGDPVYAAGTATATVTVPPVLVAVPAPPSVAPGASTTATATFSAGTTYQGTLNLACALTTSPTGAQSLPTCSMNPTSVAIATGGTGISTLTVKTTAASTASLREPSRKNIWRIGGGGAVLALIFTCGISSRRRRWISMLALLLVFSVAAAIGCGESGTSVSTSSGTAATTAGNYVFTVTGTDASNSSITTAATVTITVQ